MKYPEYKNSSIDWLGQIPSHWKLNRLKFYAKINPVKSEVSILPDDFEVTFTPMEAVKEFGGLDTSIIKNKGEVYHGYTYFKEGDVLSAKITPCYENGKATIAENLKNGIGFGTTELHVLRAKNNLNNKFLFYHLTSEPFLKVGESEMLGAGGQKRVRQEFIEDWIWGFPSLIEQKQIVEFIEQHSTKIDQLIEKKKRLLELLDEQRQAIITNAVTKGINPDAPMKDSGIDWLGEVPEHWETVALQYICRLNSGNTITASMMEEHGRYPVYGGNGLRGYFNQNTHNGDYVLIGRQGALCGNINYAHGKFWTSEHAIVVSPTVQIITKWMGELLRTMNLNQYSVSAAQPGLSAEFLGRLKIPFPPIEEQKAISDLIENRTKKIDQLKSKIQTAIDRLEEYRSSLITQAVTGKIDVRDTVDEVEMSYAAEEGELYKTNE